MPKLIIALLVIGFFYASYDNIKFWTNALLKREVEVLWWMPWILLPIWVLISAVGIYIIGTGI